MSSKADFVKLLTAIAQACQQELSPFLIQLYDEGLSKNSYESVCVALMEIFKTRSPRDSLPTVAQIQEIITPTLQNADLAKEAAARIVSAVSKFGRPDPEGAKKYIGELGWRCIEISGGWHELCAQLTIQNTSIYTAQFRDLATTMAKKSAAGIPENIPPALPQPSRNVQLIKSMADKMGFPEKTTMHRGIKESNYLPDRFQK